jgi:MFS family permease
MNIKEQNFIQYQRTNSILFVAMLMGQIFFTAITLYLNQTLGGIAEDDNLRDIFLIIVPVFFLGQMVASKIVISKKLKLARSKETLKEKLFEYRSITIIRLAMLEGVAFFSIICFLLTVDYIFLVFIGLIMILFVINKPTKEKLVEELQLKKDEQSQLEDTTVIVFDSVQL